MNDISQISDIALIILLFLIAFAIDQTKTKEFCIVLAMIWVITKAIW